MNVKLTAKQTDALLSAAYNPNARGDGMGAYVIMNVHHITRKSLHTKGLMYGHYYLTRKGTEVLAALAGNDVDMYGLEWAGSEGEEYIIPAPVVTVEGGEPNTWEPDFSAPGARECYFGDTAPVVAVFVDYVGRTEGLCASHRDRVEGQTYDVPATPENGSQDVQEVSTMDAIPTVNVVQAYMGMNGMNHYHAPGCRDIAREAKRHNAREGMGVYEFPFSSVAAIIEHEYSDCNNGDAHDMVSHANDDFDGLKIMSCLRDSLPLGEIQGMPVEFKGGRWVLGSILDEKRCDICEVHGSISPNSIDVDGKHVCGYCVDMGRTLDNLNSHSLVFYVETEGAGTKYECTNCRSIDTRGNFAEFLCEGDESPIHNAFNDDDSDAGFVETDSVDDSERAIAELQEGEKYVYPNGVEVTRVRHTVTTGTTTHTLDSEGNTWEHFDHVLSVGDVVKVVGSQGAYEVHCLIPGLPVVYVLGTQGEPFPVPASKVYAL